MRACIGMVSLRTCSSSPSHLDCRMELMPRSDRARLIDFVKFKGVVDGSRKSDSNLSGKSNHYY